MVENKGSSDWIQKYEEIEPVYQRFCTKLKGLIEECLHKEKIKFHLVECRAKSISSLKEKINREGKIYKDPLKEITDFAGIRIILFYLEDVKKVCKIIDKEFEVDAKRSVDKRDELEPDRLGYTSVHKIVSLGDNRKNLSEWVSFKGFFAEIQVRTVLEHAWATISHILQYKKEADIPKKFRRRLLRLSGLLELADEEFESLNNEQAKLNKEVELQFSKGNFELSIDVVTLREFVGKTNIAKEICDFAKEAGLRITSETHISQLVTVCKLLGIESIDTLEKRLKELKPKIKKFFTEFYANNYVDDVSGGCGHFIALLLVASNFDKLSQKELPLKWSSNYMQAISASYKCLK